MKILIGSMQCEGNSLTPILTQYEDFDYASGDKMGEKLLVMDYFKSQNVEIIPTIYAHALPGGPVKKEDFLRLCDDMLSRIPDGGFDGVWLYLHGAMCVEEIGSGDTYLVRKVRERVGKDIPISLALDFHADNTDEIISLVNCVNGFRTAPHTDHQDTQIRAAKALICCINEKLMPSPKMARANVVICGDAVITEQEPLKTIMATAQKYENEVEGMLSVQVFNGQPWIDEDYMGPSFVVTHETDTKIAEEYAMKLADLYYEVRHDFKFLVETAEPDDAVKMAMEDKENTVFLSDSGDNTTAGAVGDNAYMLKLLQEMGAKNVLLAGIADSDACDKCYKANIGDTLTLKVGGSLCKESVSTTITGRLIHKGNILSYTGGDGGESATVECEDITVVITKNRAAMCRPDIFESVNLDYTKFKTVVVKLGYLFPELARVAQRSILMFTPGCSTERLCDMNMKKIRRPMFPLDDDFK